MPSNKRTPGGAVGGFLGFVAMSAAAGVLASAAITPAIAVTGLAATSGIGVFENLPDYLAIDKLSERSNIYGVRDNGDRKLLATFYDQNRVEVKWDSIAESAKNAAIAAEDPRFYDHGGIDLPGTVRAVLYTYVLKKDLQGGSSITQQYVKNVLIQNAQSTATTDEEREAAYEAATDPTPERKLREMRMAIGLEKKYSKDKILLGYLNIALFGGRVYGIEAAANYYFGVSAKKLSLVQSATLLAIVNDPDRLRIDLPDQELNGKADGYSETKTRRDYILRSMLAEKMISEKEYAKAVDSKVKPKITEPKTGCMSAGGLGFFCDYIVNVFRNNKVFGETKADRIEALTRGGLDIYTTINFDIQNAAQDAIADNVPQKMDGFNVGSVAVTVEPKTGRILAMAQNKKFANDGKKRGAEYTAVNYNTDKAYGGSSGFQPGSTFKVFTLLQWLKEGHGLNEGVDARRREGWGTFIDSCRGGTVVSNPVDWNPRNDEGGNGGYWTALYNTINSENTGFIAMAKQLDLCGIRKTAESLGVHRANKTELNQDPSFVLGTNEIAPLTMAGAFAAIAANGIYCKPIGIDRVVGPDGEEIPVPDANCHREVDENVAATATYALQQVVKSGTAAASNTLDGTPLIGKTGTTDDALATWMSGASTKAATVVGVFNVSGFTNQRETSFASGEAATARHRIWPRIMKVANAELGGGAFPEPDPKLVAGRQETVPDVRGLTLEEAKAAVEKAGFGFADGGEKNSVLEKGLVTGTNPSGTVSRGQIIRVFVSNGSFDKVPDVVGKSPADAVATLGGAGFNNIEGSCEVDEGSGGDGVVVRQSPGGGDGGDTADSVKLTYRKATCP